MTQITFIQTADAFKYKTMLDQTSRTVTEYCKRNGYDYSSFIGVKRGFHPWQASFNRIVMLYEMMEARVSGWAVYMDADAYVYNLSFDMKSYLDGKRDKAAVLTTVPGSSTSWNVNDGVMFINLDHPIAIALITLWHRRFMDVSDEKLRDLVEWPYDINDQTFLFDILDCNAGIRDAIFFGDADRFNDCYGSVFRQTLRAYFPSLEDRISALRTAVDEVMPSRDETVDRFYPILMSALYRCLLHRDPEPGALEHFRSRFDEKGIESGFRETLAEFLVAPEFVAKQPEKPVPAEARVRAAFRWILGRGPNSEEIRHYVPILGIDAADTAALRSAMLADYNANRAVMSVDVDEP